MANTATYDDVHKTLATDCKRLLIPLINEVFGTSYDENTDVSMQQQELMLQSGVGVKKRIMDSSIALTGKNKKECLYHIESETAKYGKGRIPWRLFEYDAQMARDGGELKDGILNITFPRSAVIFLREKPGGVSGLIMRIHSAEDDGGVMDIPVRVLKIQEYSIEEIFDKHLYFLIPFYIFSHEKNLKWYNNDEGKLEELKELYEDIIRRLELERDAGNIDGYEMMTIVCMSREVLDRIAAKYKKIKEEVGEIMGGRVLEHPAKDILRRGIKQGIEQGLEQGLKQGENERQAEKKRADKAENQAKKEKNRADRAEAEVARLRKKIAAMG